MDKFLAGRIGEAIPNLCFLIIISAIFFILTYIVGRTLYENIVQRMGYSEKGGKKDRHQPHKEKQSRDGFL